MGGAIGALFVLYIFSAFIVSPYFWAKKTDRSQAPRARRMTAVGYGLAWPYFAYNAYQGRAQNEAARKDHSAASERILGQTSTTATGNAPRSEAPRASAPPAATRSRPRHPASRTLSTSSGWLMSDHLPARFSGEPVPELEFAGNPQIWVGDGQILQLPYPCHWGATAIELTATPRLREADSPATAATTQRQLAARIVAALRPWEAQGNLEIRYQWDGAGAASSLRVLLIARALGKSIESARSWSQQLLTTVASLFPAGYEFGDLQTALVGDFNAWVEIEREEEERPVGPFTNTSVVSYWYLLHPMVGDGSGWPALPGLLARSNAPGFLSVLVTPTVLTVLSAKR